MLLKAYPEIPFNNIPEGKKCKFILSPDYACTYSPWNMSLCFQFWKISNPPVRLLQSTSQPASRLYRGDAAVWTALSVGR